MLLAESSRKYAAGAWTYRVVNKFSHTLNLATPFNDTDVAPLATPVHVRMS